MIVPILELLMVKTDHKLMLSGILNEQTTQITTALTKFQISNFELERSGEWISILVTLD